MNTKHGASRASHTPEPWRNMEKEFKPGPYGLQDVIAVSVNGEVVAHVNCGFGRGEENARLIAAAPELLAALQALAEEADRHASHPVSDHRPYFTTMAARARAAIAKAAAT